MKIFSFREFFSAPLSARTITLAVAILSTIATLLSVLSGPDSPFHTTPSQALLIAAIGSGVYSLTRAVQRLKAGTPARSLFASSEAKGAAIVCLASIVTAAKDVVPPAYAGIVALIATALAFAGRLFPPNGKGPLQPAAVGLVFLTGSMLSALPISADPVTAAPATTRPAREPATTVPGKKSSVQLGWSNEKWSFQPAVAVSAVQFVLNGKESFADQLSLDHMKRIALSGGFGVVYKGLPVNVGLAGYLGVGVSQKSPNAPQFNLLFSIADVGAFGGGVQVYKDPTTRNPVWEGLITIAVNLNIGGTPTYIERLIDAYENPVPAPSVDAGTTPTKAVPDAGPDSSPDVDPVSADTTTLEVD